MLALPFVGGVFGKPEPAHETRQQQSLPDQGDDDDAKSDEDDEIAVGNGVPAAVVSGMAKAAASETTPRTPTKPKKKSHCRGGSGSRRASDGLSHRGSRAAG